jgi:hypothetical protein
MNRKKPEERVVEVIVKRRIRLEQKTCKQCGTTFLGSKRKQYCSRACVEKAAYWRNPDAYRQSRLRSYRRQKEEAAHPAPSGRQKRPKGTA